MRTLSYYKDIVIMHPEYYRQKSLINLQYFSSRVSFAHNSLLRHFLALCYDGKKERDGRNEQNRAISGIFLHLFTDPAGHRQEQPPHQRHAAGLLHLRTHGWSCSLHMHLYRNVGLGYHNSQPDRQRLRRRAGRAAVFSHSMVHRRFSAGHGHAQAAPLRRHHRARIFPPAATAHVPCSSYTVWSLCLSTRSISFRNTRASVWWRPKCSIFLTPWPWP